MSDNVANKFIEELIRTKPEVVIHTTDGRKTVCQIDEFDEQAILVRVPKAGELESHLIYKDFIVSIDL